MLIERLLGFDARFIPDCLSQTWPLERRTTFLIRSDVLHPLSVDRIVWPSIVNYGQWDWPIQRTVDKNLIAAPQWTGANHGLWDNLAELVDSIDGSRGVGTDMVCIVAISCFVNDSIIESFPVGPHLEATQPEALSPDWPILGYDIADGSRLSGLSNCGYVDDEADSFRAQWEVHLNRFHLFDDLERAAQFALVTNARVEEHAPFFVYSLRVVSGQVE